MDDVDSVDTLPEDTIPVEEGETAEPPKRRRGPGFLLGIVFGAIAGAAAATLFAPASDDEFSANGAGPAESDTDAAPRDMLRSALARFRRNLSEAGIEGRQAAHEAEADMRTRFNEMTQ